MFSLGSQRLMRATLALPCFLAKATCAASSTASYSITTPLSAGASTRTFSTSSVCFAGLASPSGVRLQGAFGKPGDRARARSPRLHGTVTGFKHRRGYGFVLAEGVVPHQAQPSVYAPLDAVVGKPQATEAVAASKVETEGHADEAVPAQQGEDMLHKIYFFTRASLMGGFYVMEGERVSFEVDEVVARDGTKRYLGAPAFGASTGGAGGAASFLTADFSLEEDGDAHSAGSAAEAGEGGKGGHSMVATAIRAYDLRTSAESPVTPITLYGKVVAWDEAAGRGEIAELDTERQFHDDAPRFPVSAEDLDVRHGNSMRAGRFVRFCLGPALTSRGKVADGLEDDTAAEVGDGAEALVAQRVIIDYTLERRRGAYGRPLVPATAEAGTVSDQTRFSGFVRDIRGAQYGFIIDDLSGESIFFHAVNARANVKEGDRVTYLLREMTQGKHVGKKACFDVRLAQRGSEVGHDAPTDDDDGAMDFAEGDARSVAQTSAKREATNVKSPTGNKKKKATADSRAAEELDFDQLP